MDVGLPGLHFCELETLSLSSFCFLLSRVFSRANLLSLLRVAHDCYQLFPSQIMSLHRMCIAMSIVCNSIWQRVSSRRVFMVVGTQCLLPSSVVFCFFSFRIQKTFPTSQFIDGAFYFSHFLSFCFVFCFCLLHNVRVRVTWTAAKRRSFAVVRSWTTSCWTVGSTTSSNNSRCCSSR